MKALKKFSPLSANGKSRNRFGAVVIALLSSVGTAYSAIVVEDSLFHLGDNAQVDQLSYTVQNANSTLVIGFYIDVNYSPGVVQFGGVTADGVIQDDRVSLAYWHDLPTGAGTLTYDATNTNTLLAGAFELSGVDQSAPVASSVGGLTNGNTTGSIVTPTDDEFVVGFAARNTDYASQIQPGTGSIITSSTFINTAGDGGGSLVGGTGLAGPAGSQDIVWNQDVRNGFANYAFQAIPEPSSFAFVFGLLTLGLAMRRRRQA